MGVTTEKRARAKAILAELRDGLESFTQRKDALASQLMPLRQDIANARRALKEATAERDGIETIIRHPEVAYCWAGVSTRKSCGAGMPIGGGSMVGAVSIHGLRLASWRALPDPVAFLLGGVGAQFNPPGGACPLVAGRCVCYLAGA